MQTQRLSRIHVFGVAGVVLIALTLGHGATARAQTAPSRAQADGCITTLPVSWSVSSSYAASWTKRLRINLHSRGPTIRGLSVTLATFGGDVLGKAVLRSPLRSDGRVTIKLRFPMQPGPYTLYFLGEPNANPSCGPKHRASVIRLVGCQARLPIKFTSAPEGAASSYTGNYSFEIRDTSGVLLKNLWASLSTVTGQLIGNVKIPVLFGELHVAIPLRATLQPAPQRYTVDISGFPPGRPHVCGAGHASRTVAFS